MKKDPQVKRKRFFSFIENKWYCHNTYNTNYRQVGPFPAVYLFVSLQFPSNEIDIVYVGSTTNLLLRYKSHKIPGIIQSNKSFSLLYFRPMERGFYDYELKLIKRLKPKYNVQHKEK